VIPKLDVAVYPYFFSSSIVPDILSLLGFYLEAGTVSITF